MENHRPSRPLAHPAARETWEEDYLRADTLLVDPAYQRPLNSRRVNHMARIWSDARCLMLEVNRRKTGEHYVMNGQHRLAAALLAGVEWLPCRIFSFPTVELEALWFAGQAEDTRQVAALDRMKAEIAGADADARAIRDLLARYGYTFNWNRGNSLPGTTRAAAALKEDYKRGPGDLERNVTIIAAAWGDAPNALSDTMLHALRFFWEKYGDRADQARLTSVLKGTEPNILRQRAANRAQLAGGGSAERHLCNMMAELYDKGKRTGRLRPERPDEG